MILPLEALIFAVPGATGVTRPAELTVAIASLLEVQVSVAAMGFPRWSSFVAVNCWVAPSTTKLALNGEMVIVVRTGAVVTVMTEGALLVILPLEALIFAVPGATGVTKPVELTVATALLLEVQVSVAVIGFPRWSRVVAVNC